MDDLKRELILTIPGDVTFLRTMGFILIFSLAVLAVSGLARLVLGKDSSPKYTLLSAMSMIMFYALCVVLYIFGPKDYAYYVKQFPLGIFTVNDAGNQVFIFNSLKNLDLPELCCRILQIFILAINVNLVGSVSPAKPKFLGWLLVRCFMLGIGIFMNYAVFKIIDMFFPFLLKGYIPLMLLSFVVISYLIALLKYVMGELFKEVNVFFSGPYDFFFKQKFGKCVGQAVGSTVIIAAMIVIFDSLGYLVLPLNAQALVSYIPFTVCMFLLWILVGFVL